MFCGDALWCHERDPRMHNTCALLRANETCFLSQLITTDNLKCLFVETLSANMVMKCLVSLPQPPYALNTGGVNKPCSTWITLWLYWRFSLSLLLNALARLWFRCVAAHGLKTLTSKNAFSHLCQKPRAALSTRALDINTFKKNIEVPVFCFLDENFQFQFKCWARL